MTENENDRFSRQLILKESGEKGQEKLRCSKALIIGAGGLGSPAALYLAAAGIGTIGICDPDSVSLSNLGRQIIHRTADINKPKTASAGEKLLALNPHITVNEYPLTLTEENAAELISGYDFILDCTDNFRAKFLISDTCVSLGKPFSHAGISGFKGQLFTYVPGSGSGIRDLLSEPPLEDGSVIGVMGALCGVIGSLQAMEAIKYFLGAGQLLTDSLLVCDALKMEMRRIKINRK